MNSELALGTVQFGLNYGISGSGQLKETEAGSILECASNAGIKVLDTAHAYGESETRLGSLSQGLDDYRIVSKAPPGTTPDNLSDSLKDSLFRLNQKSIYGYMLHSFEDFRANPSLANSLKEEKEKGYVSNVGYSLYHTEELEYLLDNNVKFDILQVPLNPLDRRFECFLEDLEKRGVEVFTRSVFLQGLFFRDPVSLPDHFKDLIPALLRFRKDIKDLDMEIDEALLSFAMSRPGVKYVVFGVDKLSDLKRNILISEKVKSGAAVIPEPAWPYLRSDNPDIFLPYRWPEL